MLKCDIPENITRDLIGIFQRLTRGTQSIQVDELKQRLKIDEHPRVRMMIKKPEAVATEFEFSVLFVSGDKGYLEQEDFLELHRNIYWVTPREGISNYQKMINLLWTA